MSDGWGVEAGVDMMVGGITVVCRMRKSRKDRL